MSIFAFFCLYVYGSERVDVNTSLSSNLFVAEYVERSICGVVRMLMMRYRIFFRLSDSPLPQIWEENGGANVAHKCNLYLHWQNIMLFILLNILPHICFKIFFLIFLL